MSYDASMNADEFKNRTKTLCRVSGPASVGGGRFNRTDPLQ